MKANELRIGNLVKFSDDGTIFTVGSIEEKGFTVQNKEETTWIEAVEFEPIPLTEEWLFKFGFSKPEWTVGGFSRTEKGNVILLDMRLRAGGSIRIDYVHQLQNLYFALTGKELTIGGNNE